MVWRALVPRPPWATGIHQFAGKADTAGLVPISGSQAYVFLTENGAAQSVLPEVELAPRLRQLLEAFPGRVEEIRHLVSVSESVVRRPVLTAFLEGAWNRGNGVVIGDAAHAPAPQMASGAALAIEDGLVLAQELGLQRSQLRSIVTALLLAQPHSHTAELCDGPPPGHPRSLRAALAFIEANLTEHISLSDIAQAAQCSPRTISSAFRDRLGLSPLSYVRSLRLDRIRADILTSTDPVGAIAYRWGVSHLGRFAGEYRERFAELPSATAARR